MGKNKPPKKDDLMKDVIDNKNIENVLTGISERTNNRISRYKTILIDIKRSNVYSKIGSLDFINRYSSTSSAEAFGSIDLGSTLLLSSFKPGKRFAHDNVKFNFNLSSAVSITRNDDYEANRLQAIKEISNKLAGYCKLPASKIEDLIKSNATLDYKAGLAAGFFDKNVTPVKLEKNTSNSKTEVNNTDKTGILADNKSTVPPTKTESTNESESSKESTSATEKAEEVEGIDNIEVLEDKPAE